MMEGWGWIPGVILLDALIWLLSAGYDIMTGTLNQFTNLFWIF